MHTFDSFTGSVVIPEKSAVSKKAVTTPIAVKVSFSEYFPETEYFGIWILTSLKQTPQIGFTNMHWTKM